MGSKVSNGSNTSAILALWMAGSLPDSDSCEVPVYHSGLVKKMLQHDYLRYTNTIHTSR